ncbi:DNA polymerase III subunit beta [Patescibacteria group bacterium]|nr:DNA polymerase III subunit beta [Patescibacteria group bacterium]
MKLNVLQENLKNSLNYLQKVIPSKPQIAVLSSILLQVKENKLTLSATDLYLGIKTELIVETEEDGELIVSGELFKSLINSLESGKLTLELKENNLIITQGRTVSKLSCQNSDEFPNFPIVEGDAFTLSLNDLEKIQSLVGFCASSDQSRPVLTAILLKFKQDGLEVIATDGFRLSNLLLKDISSKQEKTILIPAKALNELYRIAKQIEVENVDLLVSDELKQLLFKISGVEMYVRLIEGDYPPYEKIIPPSFILNIEFDGEEFLTQLKRAAIFSRDASNIVKIKVEKDKMLVTSQSPSFGDYSGEININNSSTEFGEIAFNVNYLIDFINAVKPELLEFRMNESLKPAIFRDKKTKDYFYIAMPFRVNN